MTAMQVASRPTPTFPADLVLTPVSRWPTTLAEETRFAVIDAPTASRVRRREGAAQPTASIVMVTYDGLVFTRLCLESLLAADTSIDFEVIVEDNASTDGTREYLRGIAALDGRVRIELSPLNAGFAEATNRGVARSRGDVIVFLNNDTIPLVGWLERTAPARPRRTCRRTSTRSTREPTCCQRRPVACGCQEPSGPPLVAPREAVDRVFFSARVSSAVRGRGDRRSKGTIITRVSHPPLPIFVSSIGRTVPLRR